MNWLLGKAQNEHMLSSLLPESGLAICAVSKHTA
jgi:hypothetical protein